MMAYHQIFETYKAIAEFIKPVSMSHRIQPYCDMEKAVFGYRVYDPDSGFEAADELSSEERGSGDHELLRVKGEAINKSKLYVWMKYGKELSPQFSNTETLASLESLVANREDNDFYRVLSPELLPRIVDYSEAESGISKIITSFQKAPISEILSYRGHQWPALLGFEKKHRPRKM